MRRAPQTQGFTLIELSIVLVVIGLIIGGILVGQTMMRSSQVQSVMTDATRYINAVTQFQQKFNALPGDMATATTNWGVAGGTVGTNYTTDCYSSTGAGTQTCNGSGNGQIAEGVISGSNTYADEQFRAWQHLANAQFIEGKYTGVAGSGGASDIIPGTNIPASRLDNAGFSIGWLGILSGNGSYYDGTYNHIIGISGRNTTTGTGVLPVLSASEASGFDKKYDDGQPGTGNITAPKTSVLASCTSSSTAYVVSSSRAPVCLLIFKTGF